jgi:uncharacterized membrane protein YeaQ/YmgE (transglycosylase-associated protein family)
MNFLVWIIFGAIAGWIASIVMKTNDKQGLVKDVIMGVVGAFVGGWVFSLFGAQGVTGFNLYSFFVAIIGAVIVIGIGRMLFKSK